MGPAGCNVNPSVSNFTLYPTVSVISVAAYPIVTPSFAISPTAVVQEVKTHAASPATEAAAETPSIAAAPNPHIAPIAPNKPPKTEPVTSPYESVVVSNKFVIGYF